VKIALITDTHWGVRNDNQAFLDANKQFLDDVFFPYIDSNGIESIIHLGDVVDRRKYVNINTSKRLQDDFLKPIRGRNLPFHIIAGNHDTYYKNTNEVNALRELIVDRYENAIVYDNVPEEVEFDGTKILLMPWICDQNRDATLAKLRSTDAQVAFGHLELSGFEMYRGSPQSHGDDPSLFGRFDMVCSGHYHHRSSNGNIHYLGNHAEFTWSDYNDPKGFHIFDTESRELTFIRNPYRMFRKAWYNDKKDKQVLEHDFDQYKGSFVKLIVQSKDDPFAFDLFTTRLYEAGPLEVSIVEDHHHMDEISEEELINEAEDTLTILTKYIGSLETGVDKNDLDKLMRTLYHESLSMETS